MAEAYSAAHVLSSEDAGKKHIRLALQEDDNEFFSIYFKKYSIRFMRMTHRCIYGFLNEVKNAIFPFSYMTCILSMCSAPAFFFSNRMRLLSKHDFQALRHTTMGCADACINRVGHGVLSREVFAYTLTGTGIFMGLMLFHRIALRTLLTYHSWLFEKPRAQSKTTMCWGLFVKILMGKHPLLYSFQKFLPSLPVPNLKDTVDRYLLSIESVLSPEIVERNKGYANEFLKNEGPKTQWYLILRSWLTDNYVTDWWERYIYLYPRTPVLINSNYYVSDVVNVIPSPYPCSRAAGLIYGMLRFKQHIDRGTLDPMLIRGTIPLCMDQYRRVFSTTRIPKKGGDVLVHLNRDESRHIVVLAKGSFFTLALYTDLGQPLHAFEIEAQLERIMLEAESKDPSETESRLAALTALDRDKWAESREVFFSHGVNRQSLELIETGMFVLVMDSAKPEDITEHAAMCLHGKGYDRWFDKSFNLLVYANGKAGMNCEHSWADAPVIAHLWESCLFVENVEGCYDSKGRCVIPMGSKYRSLPQPMCLVWSLSGPAAHAIEEAFVAATALVTNLHMKVLVFDEYGKELIKLFKVSPDSCIQMALQLSFYKQNKFIPLTYESSMTRLYQRGRTETVRSASEESTEFVKNMVDNNVSKDDKIYYFMRAVEKHQNTYREAMTGKGVDRHLFALYICSLGLGLESNFLKAALTEPWRLSTSQTPQRQTSLWQSTGGKYNSYYSPGGGFGPVAEDGYGVSYMVLDHNIFFHVSSKHSCPTT
eukprot:Ihof_evm27s3 gene=Ihof_evmTU27s3